MIINKDWFERQYSLISNSSKFDEINKAMLNNMFYLKTCAYYKLSDTSEYCKNNDVFLLNLQPIIHASDYEKLTADILSDLKNKKYLLVVDAAVETHREHVNFIYQFLVMKNDISPEQIVLVSSTKDVLSYIQEISQRHNLKPIKLEVFFHYEWLMKKQMISDNAINPNFAVNWIDEIKHIDVESPLKAKNFKKRYLNLNRKWAYHRVALISMLYAKDLLKHGYNSFSPKRNTTKSSSEKYGMGSLSVNSTSQNDWDVFFRKTQQAFNNNDLIQSGYDVYKHIPMYLDTRNFDFNNAYSSQIFLYRFFKTTPLSLITESFFSDGKGFRCISEKTFRAIALKQPFIIAGDPFSLDYLKEMGYKTFHGFVDESYDKEINPASRLELIVKEIEKICFMDSKELEKKCDDFLEVVEHNHNNFFSKSQYIFKLL